MCHKNTIRRFTAWRERNTTYFMCFAEGVLLSASFLHSDAKGLMHNAVGKSQRQRIRRVKTAASRHAGVQG